MADTYPDGIGADRCTHCGAVLRHGGEPMVAIRRRDAEQAATMIALVLLGPAIKLDATGVEVWTAILQRLEQAVGRPVRLLDVEK